MKNIICAILFLLTFSIYIITLTPTIYFGDSAEFATTTYLLDIAHPPSYPLYNLLGKLFNYLPISTPATRINLLSAFFASITSILIYFIILILPVNIKKELRKPFGIISSLFFSFSYTFFLHSIKSEVYTLYVLLFCIIIYLILIYDTKKDIKYIYTAAFVFGLSLGNHLLILLLTTTIIYFIITSTKKVFNIKNIIIIAFIMITQSIFYSYLPLRSAKNVKINWGRPQKTAEFKYVVSLEEQGKLFHQASSERKKWIEEKWSLIISGGILFINPFIFFLPLYFIFLTKSKVNYSKHIKTILLLFIIFTIISYFVSGYIFLHVHIPEYIKEKTSQPKYFLELFGYKPFKSFLGFPFPFIAITFFFILCSLSERSRKRLIPIILTITFLLTVFVYSSLLKYTPGYIEGNFSQFIYLNLFINQFTIYGFILGILGIFYFLQHNLRIFLFFWFLFLSYSVLIITLIYPDYFPRMQERFCLPAYLIFSVFIIFGIKLIIDYITYFLKHRLVVPVLLIIFTLTAFIPLISYFKKVNNSNYYFAKYYTDDILATLPKNSIVLSKGIDTTFTLWYRNFVEKKRPDIDIVYIDALSQDWYIDNLKDTSNINIKKLTEKFYDTPDKVNAYIRRLIHDNITKREIYYSGSGLFIPDGIEKGNLQPDGILFRITKKQERIDLSEIERTKELLYEVYKFINKKPPVDHFTKDIINIYASAHYKLAIDYIQLNKVNDAIEELNKAIELDNNLVYAYQELARIYTNLGRIDDAIRILEDGIKYNKKEPLLYFRLGSIYLNLRYIDEAIQYFKKTIELQDNFLSAYFGLVDIYLSMGDNEGAKIVLKKILVIQPDNKLAIELLNKLESR